MSDPRDRRDFVPEETAPKNTDPTLSRQGMQAANQPESAEHVAANAAQQGDERPNPHTDREAPKTAAQTGGIAIGMFFPVVIIIIVAIVVIAWFLLT
jgi:hypothetical protein